MSRLLLALLCTLTVLSAQPKWVGLFSIDKKPKFVLSVTENETQVRTNWLALGETANGYKLERFSPKTKQLTVIKDGERTELTLQPPPEAPNGQLLSGFIQLRKKNFPDVLLYVYPGADLALKIDDANTLNLKTKLLKDGTYLHSIRLLTIDKNGAQIRSPNYNVIQVPGDKIILSATDFTFEFASAN